MVADDFELLSLLMGEDTVNSFLSVRNGCFTSAMYKGGHIKWLPGVFQQLCCDGGCVLAEHITEHVIKLKVGYSQAVLGAVFLSGHVG